MPTGPQTPVPECLLDAMHRSSMAACPGKCQILENGDGCAQITKEIP